MSNTIITSYTDVSGDFKKPEKQLVVLVNKDGTLSLEKSVLQSLLDDKSHENTSVSLVHVNEDGKPTNVIGDSSDDDDDDDDDDPNIPHVNVTVNAFYDAEGGETFDKGIIDINADSHEYFMISFQNDHCYTPLTSSDQPRNTNDNLPCEIQQTVQPSQIPSSKKITILENKVIPKGKKIINLNTPDGQIILKRSDILKKIIEAQRANNNVPLGIINKINLNVPVTEKKVKTSVEVTPSQPNNPTHQSSESSSESLHDDRDSDLDYHNKSTKKLHLKAAKSKNLINKNVKTLLSRKLELKKNLSNIASEIPAQYKHGKTYKVRTLPKTNNERVIVGKKLKKTIQNKNEDVLKSENKADSSINLNVNIDTQESKPDKVEEQKNVKPVPKKDKKPPAHMTALLNDMTSLFSTPDVLRRVSTDAKSPKTPDKVITGNVNIRNEKDTIECHNASISLDKNIVETPKSKLFKSETRTYSNTNPKALQKTVILSNKQTNKESVETPVQENRLILLPQLQPQSQQNPPSHVGVDLLPVQQTLPNSVLLNPSTITGPNMNAPLSPGLDLLGGIHPEEEGLTEDLLMHVAQLVESSENLQEVIDKQVLGKVNDVLPKEIMNSSMEVPSPKTETGFHQLPLDNKPTIVSAPRKEPIQIIRSNGRVITLPPIEAPATRSSKRKSLMNSTTSQPPPIPTPQIIKVVTPVIPTPVAKQPIPNVKKQTPAVAKPKIVEKTLPQTTPDNNEEDENIESDESWNSEDDPDRLWCICKQPHNNRFMICCDLCEDWFHGKCVNITKAMGQEMEEKGAEWRCPNCLKKKNNIKNIVKPSSPRKSTDSKHEVHGDNETYLHLPTNPVKNVQSNTNCIVCKKSARASSIYCSDACILKHAQESLNVATSPNTGTKNTSNKNITADKTDTRVIVYERKTGKCLAGANAPTAANLKVWLQENPTFEVVRPGSINIKKQPGDIQKPHTKIVAPKVQSILKIGQDKQIMLVQPQKQSPGSNLPSPKTPQPTSKIILPKTPISKPPTPKTTPKESPKPQLKLQTSKQPLVKPGLKSPTTPKTPTTQQKPPPLKSPTTPTAPRKEESRSKSSGTDPIRENVRKTLQEQISIRMSESKDIKFSKEDITKFAVDTEHELHDLFKDVGTKYKAKYRSLMFNLKDRKNQSLWQKICDRYITPKQLVRLSPEELASQELAQWRDQEAKHQLELIKKSELDLLACNKTYVLKTHKGEEVIESKTTDTTELDPNVTLEDIVSALNHIPGEEEKSKENADSTKERNKSPSPSQRHKHSSHTSHHKHSKHKSRSRSKSLKDSHKRETSSEKIKRSSEKHDSSLSKSSSRSHHRKSSKERTKSSSDSKHREHSRKSSHSVSQSDHHDTSSDHHTSKSKSEHKESPERKSQKRSHSRDPSKTPSLSGDHDKRHSSSSSKEHYSSSHKHRSSSKDRKHSSKHSSLNEEKELNEIEKLIEEEKNILESLDKGDILPPEDVNVNSPPSPGTPDINDNQGLGAESDQEPSSTVDSTLSPLWSGGISMIDVAKFNVTAYEVSGTCDYITKDLSLDLEIVGRISPEIVWDYINKMKKQGNKDIMVIKLLPMNEEEKTQYNVFFSYLNSRNRLGVVRVHGGIKDFYILPLTSHTPLPSVLLPLNGPGFEELRPHLLLGIIVGQKKKRTSTHVSSVPAKVSKLKDTERSYTPPPMGSFTPPSSPKRSGPGPSITSLSSMPLPTFLPSLSSTVKNQIAASLASADDEPYSPGGSDSMSHSPPQPASTELQKKMEELNRKIEEQKKQIQYMAVNINSTESLDEPYSPSRPMSPETSKTSLPALSSISLPSNLHEILANIQKQTKASEDKPVQESYVPTAISINAPGTNSTYYQEQGGNDVDMRLMGQSFNTRLSYTQDVTEKRSSKLSSLSEAELLSMVPDNEVFPPLPAAPPPLPLGDMSIPPPPYKRPKLDSDQPPPPGLEDEED